VPGCGIGRLLVDVSWGQRTWVIIGVERRPIHARWFTKPASNSIEGIVYGFRDGGHRLARHHEFGVDDVCGMSVIGCICHVSEMSTEKDCRIRRQTFLLCRAKVRLPIAP
jgi:hypothetical protein